jgi:hypothetical protein
MMCADHLFMARLPSRSPRPSRGLVELTTEPDWQGKTDFLISSFRAAVYTACSRSLACNEFAFGGSENAAPSCRP